MSIARRSFLKTVAASAFPAAALHELIAQVPSAPASAELHVVGEGEDRFGKTHSLGFSSLAFKVGTAETGGNLFLMEHRNLMPGGGPPLHLHFNQEEWFYVMDGEVAFQVGEKQIHLRTGESVLAPRRVPHTFAAVGRPGRLLIGYTPAGKMEQFFRDLEARPALMTDGPAWSKYELQMVGPSPFAKA